MLPVHVKESDSLISAATARVIPSKDSFFRRLSTRRLQSMSRLPIFKFFSSHSVSPIAMDLLLIYMLCFDKVIIPSLTLSVIYSMNSRLSIRNHSNPPSIILNNPIVFPIHVQNTNALWTWFDNKIDTLRNCIDILRTQTKERDAMILLLFKRLMELQNVLNEQEYRMQQMVCILLPNELNFDHIVHAKL